jgi:hypothetical protein
MDNNPDRPNGGLGRGERPQSGNPHQITYNQHVFPARSIGRFAGINRTVEVYDRIRSCKRKAASNDVIFCAQRSWDERSEKGYMKEIEADFQNLVSMVTSNAITFNSEQIAIINKFFWLWYFRARRRLLERQEIQLNAVSAESRHTKDDEERLEKAGVMFIRPNATLPARFISGTQIHMDINRQTSTTEARWVVVDASDGEFIVPDQPCHLIIPITPQMCLVDAEAGGTINQKNVGDLNAILFNSSERYFFARKLSACPIYLSEFSGVRMG